MYSLCNFKINVIITDHLLFKHPVHRLCTVAYREFLKGEAVPTQPNVVGGEIYLSGRNVFHPMELSTNGNRLLIQIKFSGGCFI